MQAKHEQRRFPIDIRVLGDDREVKELVSGIRNHIPGATIEITEGTDLEVKVSVQTASYQEDSLACDLPQLFNQYPDVEILHVEWGHIIDMIHDLIDSQPMSDEEGACREA